MSPFCNHFGLFCQNFSHFWLKFLLLLLHYWDFFAKLGRQLGRGSQPRRYTFRPSRHFCLTYSFSVFNSLITLSYIRKKHFWKLLIFDPKKGQFSRKIASKQQQHSALKNKTLFSHFFFVKTHVFWCTVHGANWDSKMFCCVLTEERACMQGCVRCSVKTVMGPLAAVHQLRSARSVPWWLWSWKVSWEWFLLFFYFIQPAVKTFNPKTPGGDWFVIKKTNTFFSQMRSKCYILRIFLGFQYQFLFTLGFNNLLFTLGLKLIHVQELLL